MAETNSQETRSSRLTTPEGSEPLVLIDFSGMEYVNELNSFRVRGLATKAIKLNDLLGKPIQIQLLTPSGTLRHFHQITTSGRYVGAGQGGHIYELELHPWIWLAGKRMNSRIFHRKTVRQILTEIVAEYGGVQGTSLLDKLNGTYPEMEYTVQYGESDLDFMRRLMEEFGINFHCEMAEGSHKLVLTDENESFVRIPGLKLSYNPAERGAIIGEEHFESFSAQQQMTTGTVRMMDYNFTTPNAAMDVQHQISREYQGSGQEIYEYPGRYLNKADGNTLVKRRIQGMRLADSLARGAGQAISLCAGGLFTLKDHPDATLKGDYIVLAASHHYSANSYRSGGGGAENSYHGDYTMSKVDHIVAPARVTQRPVMRGPQTAVVVEGAEGSIDKYGRIWISFHWDRQAKSLPCRVSQSWAGPQWGSVFIPRVGMEVVVEFLDGDPDRPLITGCVYNAVNMPPWELPGKKTVSGYKTETMGGGGYNEMSFDDKPGAEKIVVHGQYDMETTIEHDVTTKIKNDSTTDITGNEQTTITGTSKTDIKKTSTITVTQDLKITSQSKIELTVGTSKITMTPDSIKITSTNVEVTATASLKTAALKAEHGATADLAIQSAMVRINS